MDKYIIISLKHSEGSTPIFWRANASGYTYWLHAAGIYTAEEIKADPDYYNDGYNSIAIPITDAAFNEIGLKMQFSPEKCKAFFHSNKIK